MSDDLARWLGAQLDEGERIARGAGGTAWLEFSDGGWVYTAPVPMAEWKGPGDDGHHVASVRLASDRAHILHNDPARVLREIDAGRKLIDEHKPGRPKGRPNMERHCLSCTTAQAWDEASNESNCLTLRLLALPYVDRPGYREEWRP